MLVAGRSDKDSVQPKLTANLIKGIGFKVSKLLINSKAVQRNDILPRKVLKDFILVISKDFVDSVIELDNTIGKEAQIALEQI